MSYVPFSRAVLLGVLALGLAACCSQPPQGHRPPPPASFGPGGPPPPHAGGYAGPRPPEPGFHEAIAACAEELDLPAPSAGGARARPELTPEQRDLLEVCLEEQGYLPPPPPEPGDREDPV